MPSNKILCIGEARTGTTSLSEALKTLGFANPYNSQDYYQSKSHYNFWNNLKKDGSGNVETFFKNYDSILFYPGILLYKKLLKIYSFEKIILTVRDPDAWYTSMHNTLYSNYLMNLESLDKTNRSNLTNEELLQIEIRMFEHKLIWSDRFKNSFHVKETAKKLFIERNKSIEKEFPSSRLLVYNFHEDWKPLCKFLNKKIPNVKYPKKNQFNEYWEE